MEIKVRNLEPMVVRSLDELAVKNGFTFQNGKPNREEYLRWHLRQLSLLGELGEIENKYYELAERMGNVLRLNQREIMDHLSHLEDEIQSIKKGTGDTHVTLETEVNDGW